VAPRDTQRARLYAAERAAAAAAGDTFHGRTIPNDECQAWVDDLMRRPAMQSRWGIHPIDVIMKRGGSAYGGGGRITLPLFARNPWVILHEVAHNLTPNRYAAHGPEFAGVLLFLVRTRLGNEAGAALLAEYRTHKVRRNTAAVPAPTRPVVTKAQRAAKERARRTRPVTADEAARAADVLRRAAANGAFGPAGSKPRTYALAAARTLNPKR
jgi:putative metallohydrolase (TIGR04338 family)